MNFADVRDVGPQAIQDVICQDHGTRALPRPRKAPPRTVELPADLVFSARLTILSALTQGPAVALADRGHPLRRSSGSPPNRPCHSEVAGQGAACRLWSGCSRPGAPGKLAPAPQRAPAAGRLGHRTRPPAVTTPARKGDH